MNQVCVDNRHRVMQQQKADRRKLIFLAQKQARALEKKLLVSDKHLNVNAALRHICFVLYDIAQRCMLKTGAIQRDFATFIYCGHILKEIGLRPKTDPGFDQTIENLRLDVVRSSFAYRDLRNKLLASLSVIADLPERSAGNGSPDYQRGVREGYKRASDIAILFLEDLTQ